MDGRFIDGDEGLHSQYQDNSTHLQHPISSNSSAIIVPQLDISVPPEQNPSIAELLDSASIPVPPSNASNASTDGYNYHLPPHPQDDFDEEYTDDNAREVTYGRLIQGHIVDDDYPPPSAAPSVMEDDGAGNNLNQMTTSIYSVASSHEHALGGTIDAPSTDDEEEADIMSGEEKMITLVGQVRGRTVLIIDDMIDRPGSWIAAAEHCVKRAGASKVYCIATHGVFGGDCLEEMEACGCIHQVSPYKFLGRWTDDG